MEEYYTKLAEDYEEIHHRDHPDVQEELRQITDIVKRLFKGRKVLEIACGTGYWTQIASCTTSNVVATDTLPEMLKIAKRKQCSCPVSFLMVDAQSLSFRDSWNP